MNKNIKKLAQAKADKEYGGEDRSDQRRRLKAKPYRKERVSQTEHAREIHRGGYTDSEGKDHDIGWDEAATYNADNKGHSATMGRRIQETKRHMKRYSGYNDKEAGRDAVEYENWKRDATYKESDLKKYEDSGWDPKSPGGRAVEGAHKAYDRYWKKSLARDQRVNRRLYANRASMSPGAPIRQRAEEWKNNG